MTSHSRNASERNPNSALVAEVEAFAERTGQSLAAVLRQAEVAPSTFYRWKQKDFTPNHRALQRLREVVGSDLMPAPNISSAERYDALGLHEGANAIRALAAIREIYQQQIRDNAPISVMMAMAMIGEALEQSGEPRPTKPSVNAEGSSVGERLRAARYRAGLSAKDLGARVGDLAGRPRSLSESAVRNVENGTNGLKTGLAPAFAQILNVTPEWLLYGR